MEPHIRPSTTTTKAARIRTDADLLQLIWLASPAAGHVSGNLLEGFTIANVSIRVAGQDLDELIVQLRRLPGDAGAIGFAIALRGGVGRVGDVLEHVTEHDRVEAAFRAVVLEQRVDRRE